MDIYIDCNATTPMEEDALKATTWAFKEYFGNSGSRTHQYGEKSKKRVYEARENLSAVVGLDSESVIFTSGATESNNLAILGLREYGLKYNKKHIISSSIEHKAVLEPLQYLGRQGFEIELLSCNASGRIDPDELSEKLRPDTLLVSIMHANNETGILQPVEEIAQRLEYHDAYFHVDAAQTYGKLNGPLRNSRIDMLSCSAHKIYGPRGVGCLMLREEGREVPLNPIIFGGDQEMGFRAGTAPVPLIVGFDQALNIAELNKLDREQNNLKFRKSLFTALSPLNPLLHGDQDYCMDHVINLSFDGLDSEAVMLALKGIISISNGSACTSDSYEPSHVLQAMQLSEETCAGALRFSWCHMTEIPDWEKVVEAIEMLM